MYDMDVCLNHITSRREREKRFRVITRLACGLSTQASKKKEERWSNGAKRNVYLCTQTHNYNNNNNDDEDSCEYAQAITDSSLKDGGQKANAELKAKQREKFK